WSKNAPFCLTVQSRDQGDLVLLEADIKTGKTKTLLTEQCKTWVNLRQEVPRWLPSGDSFLWGSEKDDLPRVELRTRTGKGRRVAIPADVGYQGIVSVSKDGKEIIVAGSVNPTEMQLYRYSTTDPFGEVEPITKTPGMHGAVFSRDHSLYVLASRTMTTMPTS